MKKMVEILTVLSIFVISLLGAEEPPTGITQEEAEAMLEYYNDPDFPEYQEDSIFKFPHPSDISCGPVMRQVDTDGDGATEDYALYSLADCGGVNYVSRIVSQVEGNCIRWASTGALEASISVMLKDFRPGSSPNSGWSPVNLSESWTTVMTGSDDNPDFLGNMSEHGTTHGYYFPFHTTVKDEQGTDWETHWNKILKQSYSFPECNTAVFGFDYEKNVKACMFAKQKEKMPR